MELNMETQIDKFGRIVLPKKLRDALDLRPGTKVRLIRKGRSIVLSAATAKSALVLEHGRWVYARELEPGFDFVTFINSERERRLDSL